MTPAAHEEDDAPVWARPDAFPKAPEGWGWMDYKRREHPCPSKESLIDAIHEDCDADVAAVWGPAQSHAILPEELPEATDVVVICRKRRALADMANSLDRLHRFGWLLAGVTAYRLYQGWIHAPGIAQPGEQAVFALRAVLSSVSMGIVLLMFLIFAFIPWYQARKRLTELARWTPDDMASIVPVLRFETWLEWQKAPVTRILLILISIVGLCQLLPGNSLDAAGMTLERYAQGEWWRLFTAPLMHGNPIHFLMNAAALVYLGKRIEVFARWPHVPLVFLFAAYIGGETSVRFLAPNTIGIGASGGLMGWLGFLLVFESLHSRLVPRQAKRRLIAGVLLTALIGAIGCRFIDNAAHAGGLLAGMLYAAIVFPKSASPTRPRTTATDRIAGSLALLVLAAATLFAAAKIAL